MKKTIFGKISSMFIVLGIILSMFTMTFVSADTVKNVYISSENYSTASGDGTWDNGIWEARAYDSVNKTQTTLETVVDFGGVSSYALDSTATLVVSSGKIVCPRGTLTEDSQKSTWSEMTFTAPRSGNITISVNGTLSAATAWSGNAFVNHQKYNSKDASKNMVALSTGTNQNDMWQGNKFDKTIYIQKGEKINFLYQPGTVAANITRELTWDPKITYNDEPVYVPTQKDLYKSSENFAINADGTWDNGVWRAQIHRFETETTALGDLSTPGDYIPIYYSHTNSYTLSNGPLSVYSSTDDSNNHIVGAKSMRTPIMSDDTVEDIREYSVVKTFTAPRNGEVVVSCDGAFTAGTAYVLLSYVTLEKADGSTKILSLIPINSDSVSQWKKDLVLSLEKGDKIHFEAKRRAANHTTVNGWKTEAIWDPTITYTKGLYRSKVEFKKSDEVVTTFAEVAGIGEVDTTITVSMNEAGTVDKTVRACVAVYDQSGKLASVGFSNADLVKKDFSETTFEVTLNNKASVTNGKVKIFLLEDSSIMPCTSNINYSFN